MLLTIPRISPTNTDTISTSNGNTSLITMDLDATSAAGDAATEATIIEQHHDDNDDGGDCRRHDADTSPTKQLKQHYRTDQLRDVDVVFGRGGFTYSHKGNRLFRRLVQHNHELYHSTNNAYHRQAVASSIVNAIHRTGGKFVKKDRHHRGMGSWVSVTVKDACLKTCQALRDANIRAQKTTKNNGKKMTTANDGGNQGSVPVGHSGNCMPSSAASCSQIVPNDETVQEDDMDHIDPETVLALVQSLVTSQKEHTPMSTEWPDQSSQDRSAAVGEMVSGTQYYRSSPYRSSFNIPMEPQEHNYHQQPQQQQQQPQLQQQLGGFSNSIEQINQLQQLKMKELALRQSFNNTSASSLHQQSASIMREIQEEFLSPDDADPRGINGENITSDNTTTTTNINGGFKRNWSSVTSISICEALLLSEFENDLP